MKTETRYYLLNTFDLDDKVDPINLTNDEFIELCEEQGKIYTSEGFQEAFNKEDINTAIDQLRIIEVVCDGLSDLERMAEVAHSKYLCNEYKECLSILKKLLKMDNKDNISLDHSCEEIQVVEMFEHQFTVGSFLEHLK